MEQGDRPDWDGLLQQLSRRRQKRFTALLRRSLKRHCEELQRGSVPEVPASVRAEAVGQWRKRLVKRGHSKTSVRRLNYERLRKDPGFQQVERRLLDRYLAKHGAPSQAVAPDYEAMSFAEACDAYRALHLNWHTAPLGVLAYEAAAASYRETAATSAVQQELASDVCEFARTCELSSVASLRVADAAAPHRFHRQGFHLNDASTHEEVTARVRDAQLVRGVLAHRYPGRSVARVAQGKLVAHVLEDPSVMALDALLSQLHDTDDVMRTVLERTAKRHAQDVERFLESDAFVDRVAEAVLGNPVHGRQFRQSVELKLRVRENVPETPMEAYPLARTLKRHFVLHVGPTNSGKTHAALGALEAARSGAYLGPLRLLAYEQFERMNKDGRACSLVTGEELCEVAGARHVSSTVEMADLHRRIDVAVIDEAQMIADSDRGHHWTAAILGMPAAEVHVCCAPHAEQVVRRLVDLCEDDCEVVRHERLVPLRPDKGSFRMPASIERGDALIVFSRRAVHAVAADVAAQGLKPSVIYGALPHDVRHEEARRFDEGETDVVVATDAIGMGMNLPIRRIVFVEQEKYDGHTLRMLRAEEVQQIAGRAGRFGRYDVGLFQSARKRKELMRLCKETVPDIEVIPVGIPDDIALVRDATLSDCILQWMSLTQPTPFQRVDAARDLALIGEVERQLDEDRRRDTDTKLMVLALATMPFDERDRNLKEVWRRMVEAELGGKEAEICVPDLPSEDAGLARLEEAYRMCDLLYTYARTFDHPQNRKLLTERRTQISHIIMGILAHA